MRKSTGPRKNKFYNLNAIISVGYRVYSKTKRGTQFRQWATQRLKDYLVQGYAISEKRLAQEKQEVEYLYFSAFSCPSKKFFLLLIPETNNQPLNEKLQIPLSTAIHCQQRTEFTDIQVLFRCNTTGALEILCSGEHEKTEHVERMVFGGGGECERISKYVQY